MLKSGVGVEKLPFRLKQPNLGDRKCLPDPRKSIVGLPDAILFLRISRAGVFQQPQAFTLRTRIVSVIASRVENRRSNVSLPVDTRRGFRRATAVRFGVVLFPVPAHRTGQADFPHPALGKDTRSSV